MTERVFIIDTNVFVSGLLTSARKSPTVRIVDAMLSGTIIYVVSPALLEEYQTVLLRPKIMKLHGLGLDEIETLLSEIVANAIWREPSNLHPAPDEGDNHLWSLLLETDDTILVTGDQLLVSKPPLAKSVVTPVTFLNLFFKTT